MSRTALTIGSFDAVHVGHQRLVQRARDLAGHGGRVVALAFDPHPAARLRPGTEPPRLTTFEQRAALLRAAGATHVERLEPTDELLAQSPEAFIRGIVDRFAPAHIVEGPDFHFGRARAGSVRTLHELSTRFNFTCDVVEPADAVLTDHQIARASSTLARFLLAQGRVRDLARVLSRPHEIAGEVVPGDQRGRTIGVPTANLRTAQMLPADGVYAALADAPGAESIPAAVSVGSRPTLNGTGRRLEAHLLHPDGSPWRPPHGTPDYFWPLRLRLVAWVRDDLRFPSLEALRAQIARDLARVPSLALDQPPPAPTLSTCFGSTA